MSSAQDTELSYMDVFRDRLRQPDIVAALFFPPGHASWENKQLSLGKDGMAAIQSSISGARLHLAEPGNQALVQQCQQDMANLIRSLTRLRDTPKLATLVLSDQCVVAPEAGNAGGKRARFGLALDPRGGPDNETNAARLCHRRIVRAIKQAGFAVKQPSSFKAKTGFAGLSEWCAALQLRRRNRFLPWLVAFLVVDLVLLLLLGIGVPIPL